MRVEALQKERSGAVRTPRSHHEATSARPVHRPCHCWGSCVWSADAAKLEGDGGVLFFFVVFFLFRECMCARASVSVSVCFCFPGHQIRSGLLGEGLERGGKGLKSKITNCHLIWQLECSFDVWRTTTPQCKETLTLQCNQEPCQSAPGTVSMLLCAWIGFLLGTKGQSEYVSVKGFPVPYSQDCCLLGADEAKQTVYSEHFALEQFILLSFYCRGFF